MANVIGYECRRATYVVAKDKRSDVLAIKEYTHYDDGTIVPNMRYIVDYKRNFWITKPAFRNHKDLKDWEHVSKLQKYTTTQLTMNRAIARALQYNGSDLSLKSLAASPYLYGADIGTPSIVKHHYQKKWPNAVSPACTVATLDIETDVNWGTEEIIIISYTYKTKSYLYITDRYLEGVLAPIDRINAAVEKHIGEYLANKGRTIEIVRVETPALAVVAAMDQAHIDMPDLVSIWNMDFDLPKMTKALETEGYIPATIYSAPDCPNKYKFFNYTEGPKTKKKSNGDEISLHVADRWHKPVHPASFFFIDSMAVYKTIRIANGMEPNYKLDGTLERNLGFGKFKLEEADHLKELAWHKLMQASYKAEYAVYAACDTLYLLELDEFTNDISQAFPILCDISEYENFKSNPRRIVDDMHFFCLDNDHVIATCPRDVTSPLDEHVVGLDDWIVTLQSRMMDWNGVKVIKEAPNMKTLIFVHCSDIDVTTTYPRIEQGLNISKNTRRMELAAITNMDETQRRRFGVNFLGGVVNATQLAVTGYGMPTPDQWLEHYDKVAA